MSSKFHKKNQYLHTVIDDPTPFRAHTQNSCLKKRGTEKAEKTSPSPPLSFITNIERPNKAKKKKLENFCPVRVIR